MRMLHGGGGGGRHSLHYPGGNNPTEEGRSGPAAAGIRGNSHWEKTVIQGLSFQFASAGIK